MLKDGHKHLSGLDEAVIKNIDACKQLSKITRTSLGPNGATTRNVRAGAGAGCPAGLSTLGSVSSPTGPPRARSHQPRCEAEACRLPRPWRRHEQDGYQPPGQAVRD